LATLNVNDEYREKLEFALVQENQAVVSVLLGDPEGAEKSMIFHSSCFGEAFIKTEKSVSEQSGRN
jgi:hypothetical protein